MPYKEKIAWLSLAAMVLAFGPYFAIAAIAPPAADQLPNMGQLRLFAGAVLLQVAVLGGGRLILRRTSPIDAGLPADERDRAIERVAVQTAYYFLISGMILVGCIMPFQTGGWRIVNAGLFVIVLAELVHYGVVAVGYRRQRS